MYYLIDLLTLFVSICREKISPWTRNEAKEMLKRFSVTNFSSFKDEQVFDMTVGTTKVLADHAIDFGDVKIGFVA